MAQALGYVTQTDKGGFEGTLATMSLNKRIHILPNTAKETDAQPDYRIRTEDGVEIGGGWNRTGRVSGNDYVSLTFAAPEFGPNRIYANLGRAAGEDDRMAILWNPKG